MSSILYSNLPYKIDEAEKLINLAKTYQNGRVGMEYFTHTNDKEYMQKLKKLASLNRDIPVSFHGPYVSVEATSPKGTLEYDWLIESYKMALDLAGDFHVKNMVLHYTGKTVLKAEKDFKQKTSFENIRTILDLAEGYGVQILIENLPPHHDEVPLYDLQEFLGLFKRFPDAGCIIDIGHSNITRWPTSTLLTTLKDTIKSYHLHNNDGLKDTHARILDGTLDMNELVDLYKKYTPEADCVLEYNNHGERTLEGIKADTDWLIERVF